MRRSEIAARAIGGSAGAMPKYAAPPHELTSSRDCSIHLQTYLQLRQIECDARDAVEQQQRSDWHPPNA